MTVRKAILLIMFVLCTTLVVAQPTFSRLYDFNFKGVSFKSIVNHNDSLFVIGNCLDEEHPYWGIYFAMFDTLGYVDCLVPQFDSTTRLLAGNYPNIAKDTNELGFVGFRKNAPIVFRSDYMCGSVSSKAYPDITTRVKSGSEYLLSQGIHRIAGSRQNLDYDQNGFVMSINSVDSVLWETEIGIVASRERVESLVLSSEGLIVAGLRSNNNYDSNTPLEERFFWSEIVTLDENGTILDAWKSDREETNENGAFGLKQTSDDGWIYITSTFEIIDSAKAWSGGAIKVVRREANFDLLWERRLSPEVDVWNEAIDVQPSGDGNWIAGGRYLAHDNYPEQFPWYGIGLSKITDDGDILWSVLEASPEDTMAHWDNFLGGFTVLSSGSIIAAGYSNVYEPVAKSWAWLLKVTADGCVDTLCMTTPTEDILLPMSDVVASPNPTRGAVTFSFDADMTTDRTLTLYSPDGSQVGRKNVPRGQGSVEMDLSDEVPGLYFYTLESRGRLVGQGKVVRVE